MLSAAEIQRELDAGKSMTRIAEEFGVKREAVVYRVRVLGLKRPPPKKALKVGKRPPTPPSDIHSKPASSRRKTRRECITCSEFFQSDGPHNRMCSDCRREGTEITIYSLGEAKK